MPCQHFLRAWGDFDTALGKRGAVIGAVLDHDVTGLTFVHNDIHLILTLGQAFGRKDLFNLQASP